MIYVKKLCLKCLNEHRPHYSNEEVTMHTVKMLFKFLIIYMEDCWLTWYTRCTIHFRVYAVKRLKF